jgi:hypothetical protein
MGQKGEKPSEPKNGILGLQNQYGRVIYPSIGNFIWSKKRHTSGGQKRENKPLEPKNRIMEQKNIYFWGSCENKPSEQYVIPDVSAFGPQILFLGSAGLLSSI